jgi:hypothetical protein
MRARPGRLTAFGVQEKNGWTSVPYFDELTSVEEVMASATELDPFVRKGFVITDTSDPSQYVGSSARPIAGSLTHARWWRWLLLCAAGAAGS